MIDINRLPHESRVSTLSTEEPIFRVMTRGLRRRWLSSLFLYLMAMALITGVLLIVPRKYISESKLFVLLGRGAVTLDPTATTSKNVQIQETRDAEIHSVADLLASRALLEQVVDKVGVERILASTFILDKWIDLPEFEFPSFSKPLDGESVEEASDDYLRLKRRERAIRRLESDFKVRPTKKAATITVSCRASSPKLAQDIVRQAIDTYQRMHIDAHHTAGSHPFFEEQYAYHQKQMESAWHSFRDLKNETGMVSIDGARTSLQTRLDNVQLSLQQTEADHAAAEERLRRLTEQFQALDPEIISSSVEGNANEGADLMRDRLYSLEMKEKELVARFNENHPEVRSVRESIGTARRVLDQYPYDRQAVTTAANPVRLSVQRNLLVAAAEERSLDARRNALTRLRGELLASLNDLNANEARVEVARRNLDVAEKNFHIYAEKVEEARINQALDAVQISNVNVVQQPTFVIKAVSPKRALILLVSSVAMAALVAALATMRESHDTTIRTAEDLARALDVPVLTTLPKESSRTVIQHS